MGNAHGHMRTAAAAVLIALVVACCACALCGCLPSDTITERIYDTEEDSLQLPDAQTVLYNDINAKETTDALPKLEADPNADAKEDTDQDLPRYGGDTSKALVARPTYAKKAPENDESRTSTAARDESRESTGTGSSSAKRTGSGSKSKKGRGTKATDDGGKNNDATGKKKTGSGSGKKSDKAKVYEDYGDAPEIPEGVTKVTAVGQAAVIVSMLGGGDEGSPLVGADAALLGDEGAQKALARRGIAGARELWSEDGASGDLTSVKALKKAAPDLCFVLEGDETFTDAQLKKVLAAGLPVYELPALTSARKICYAVQIVGKILEKGGSERAGKAYEDYIAWHDMLVDKVKGLNGGIAGGFNYNTGKKASGSADALYTLFMSEWDYGARYADANSGYLSSADGAGICPLSYKDSPLCHYLSVGGVVNNAGSGPWRSTSLSGQTAVAWQFSQTTCPSAYRYWAALDREKATYAPSGGNGLDNALMWSSVDEVGLGTERFLAVIVATQEMASALERDASRADGIYHPYPVTSTAHGSKVSGVGYVDGDSLIRSAIGTQGDGASSAFYEDGSSAAKGAFGIHVNPHGMFSSWTDGSVESVLEAAWAYQTFHDGGYDLEFDVRGFYETFYGHELSSGEYRAIIDGQEK